jgi:hypothetical protein
MDLTFELTKPKIFSFGACDLGYALKADIIRKDFSLDTIDINRYTHDSLEFDKSWVPNHATSLMSLYTPPGDIASRLHDTLVKSKELKPFHYEFYREIVKYPYIKHWETCAGPNDIMVINFSTELYTKIACKSELFTALPGALKTVPGDPVYWVLEEYIQKEEYQFTCDDEYALNATYELLADFAKDIYRIFKDRVVLVKTHLTDLEFNNGTICKSPIGSTISYKRSKIINDFFEHEYGRRVTNIFIKKFRNKYPADLPIVEVKDHLFVDPKHPGGYAPFHLHNWSAHKIGSAIYDELVKINTRSLKETSNVNTSKP